MNTELLNYYEAIEQASADMLARPRPATGTQVVKLEGACVLLISQLKHAAAAAPLDNDAARTKARIMQRILVNDAEIRHLAEPWLQDLDDMMAGKRQDPALTPPTRQRAMFQDTRPAALDARRAAPRPGPLPRRAARRDAGAAAPAARRQRAGGAERPRAVLPVASLWSVDTPAAALSLTPTTTAAAAAPGRVRRGRGRGLPRQRQAAVRPAGPAAGARARRSWRCRPRCRA
jgi:flagellar protein FliT